MPNTEVIRTWTTTEALEWDHHVSCTKDPIHDLKSCHMHIVNLSLWIHVHHRGSPSVTIGTHHYPGSTVALRINNEKPFVTNGEKGFDAKTSAIIIQKLTKNPKVVTRYQKWPEAYPTDNMFQMFGFAEAYEYITWAVQQMK